NSHLLVQVARRRDVDHVDVRTLDEFLPVGLVGFPSPALRRLLDSLRVPPADGLHHDTVLQRKEHSYRLVRVRMGLAHELVSDQTYIDLTHRVPRVMPTGSGSAKSRVRSQEPETRMARPWLRGCRRNSGLQACPARF